MNQATEVAMPTATVEENSSTTDRNPRDVRWYEAEITDFSPACRDLLENYSHIEPDRVNPHVKDIREKAWAIFPYPCIGRFRFLDLSISLHPAYQRVLSTLKDPNSDRKLLDLGCCFAQDIRKLVHDGVASERLYACDLEQGFLDLSYDLFADRDKMRATLFAANIFEQNSPLDALEGKMDIIYAASFLHLFGWDDQIKICKKMIRLLKPQKGSMVFGRQTGNTKGRVMENIARLSENKSTLWRHDASTFENMWNIAGEETGTKWKTRAVLDKGDGFLTKDHWAGDEMRRLRFEVERVE